MTDVNVMGITSALIDNINGTGGYTDPLIFAIPIALVVIVIVIVVSASKIDSQQTRIRNEDRLLDTLERIRLENMVTMEGEEHAKAQAAVADNQETHVFMGGLGEGPKTLKTLAEGSLSQEREETKSVVSEDEVSEDSDEVYSPVDSTGEIPDVASRYDYESDEDEDFDTENEPEKPSNAVCDPDGLCFMPLPGQTVEEARYIARAKRDGTYESGVTEEEAAAKFGYDAVGEDNGTELLEEPGEEPGETESTEEVVEESEAEPEDEPVEEPEVELVEETIEETVGKPETESCEEVAEEPVEEIIEEPTEEPEEEPLEKPESKTSRLRRLKERLAGKGKFGRAILGVLSRADLADDDWEDLEDELLSADFGVEATVELIDKLKTKQKIAGTKDAKEVRRMAKRLIGDFLDRHADRELNLKAPEGSECNTVGVLMVGVNGAGKTTTVGKLARFLVANRKSVVLGAADTFRAAAGEQLETWGKRVGVPVIRSEKDKADPASVAFDAAKAARDNGADVVLIDTAGRLQNKSGLMDELGKIKRVAEKQVPITEVLLVIDATTGQNALSQAKIFAEAVGVTGVVLTKLDGSAKGGVIIPLQRELGIPVKLVGLGEGSDDLAPFIPADFADALLNV